MESFCISSTQFAVMIQVSMPTKFRKNVWIKRGDFIMVQPIEEGDKVKAEIAHILVDKHHIKFIKQVWLTWLKSPPRDLVWFDFFFSNLLSWILFANSFCINVEGLFNNPTTTSAFLGLCLPRQGSTIMASLDSSPQSCQNIFCPFGKFTSSNFILPYQYWINRLICNSCEEGKHLALLVSGTFRFQLGLNLKNAFILEKISKTTDTISARAVAFSGPERSNVQRDEDQPGWRWFKPVPVIRRRRRPLREHQPASDRRIGVRIWELVRGGKRQKLNFLW